jgi:hypothetical protein
MVLSGPRTEQSLREFTSRLRHLTAPWPPGISPSN